MVSSSIFCALTLESLIKKVSIRLEPDLKAIFQTHYAIEVYCCKKSLVNYTKPLIILTGPTASGKTGIILKLAEKYPIEIISADSMQIYRGMDIATAKPTPEEQKILPHHLIDIMNPDEEYNAGAFRKDALRIASEIESRGHIPIVAGGTGLYIKALIFGLSEGPTRSEEIRENLRDFIRTNGPQKAWEILNQHDPDIASKISPSDASRIIRYMEMILLTGEKPSAMHDGHGFREPKIDARVFCISMERDVLYERINLRVTDMIGMGLVDETKKLLEKGYSPTLKSMQALGYKHLVAHLLDGLPLDEAILLVQRDTRHYAKRQMTWNRGHYGTDIFCSVENAFKGMEKLIDKRLSS
jgi:tRNA dimethylallyltransferase